MHMYWSTYDFIFPDLWWARVRCWSLTHTRARPRLFVYAYTCWLCAYTRWHLFTCCRTSYTKCKHINVTPTSRRTHMSYTGSTHLKIAVHKLTANVRILFFGRHQLVAPNTVSCSCELVEQKRCYFKRPAPTSWPCFAFLFPTKKTKRAVSSNTTSTQFQTHNNIF